MEVAFETICLDASQARVDLARLAQSLDIKSIRAVLKTAKSIEDEVNRVKTLKPFDSAKLLSFEECIRFLKSLCPIKLKSSCSIAEFFETSRRIQHFEDLEDKQGYGKDGYNEENGNASMLAPESTKQGNAPNSTLGHGSNEDKCHVDVNVVKDENHLRSKFLHGGPSKQATSSQSIPLVAKTSKAVTTGKEVIFGEGTELPKDILEIKEEDVSVTKEECEASCPLDVSAQEDFSENMPQPCSEVPEQGYCDPKIVEEIFCKEEKNEGPLVRVEGSVSGVGISEAVGNSIEEASLKSIKGIPVAVSGVKSCDPCMENGRKKQVEIFVNQIDDADFKSPNVQSKPRSIFQPKQRRICNGLK
ncbi:hypothetical protein U1Q18_032758 [Sarracenia purpurea var. burkii]